LPPSKSSFIELVNKFNAEKNSTIDESKVPIKLNVIIDTDSQLLDESHGDSTDPSCREDRPSDRSQELGFALPDGTRLPRHHTSLIEESSLDFGLRVSRSLVQPLKPRGPAPLPPPRLKPRRKPRILDVPADEDLLKYYRPPEFTLCDFIRKFSDDENVPVEHVEQTIYSPFTYAKLQTILAERCRPRNATLATQQLHWPADAPTVIPRIPRKQLLIEMAAIIKEHLSKVENGRKCKHSCSF